MNEREISLVWFDFFVLWPINLRRYYLPTPPLGQDMTQGQFLSGVLTGFEFRVFLLLG